MKAVLIAAARLARRRAVRHPAVHPVPRPARLRPVHPRRRPDLAPHQARHARRWAARSSSARRSSAYAVAHLLTLHAADGERRARAVPHGRARAWSASSTTTSRSPSSAASACAPARSSPARRWSAIVFAVLALQFPNSQLPHARPRRTSRSSATPTSTSRSPAPLLGLMLFVIWANIMIAGTSQRREPHRRPRRAGDRRLVMVFAAYVLIGIWQFNQNCQTSPGMQVLRGARPARPRRRRRRRAWAPASGSCGGTPRRPRSSWATPARSPSAARSPGLAITTRTELLLVILGGLFVADHALGDHPGRRRSR